MAGLATVGAGDVGPAAILGIFGEPCPASAASRRGEALALRPRAVVCSASLPPATHLEPRAGGAAAAGGRTGGRPVGRCSGVCATPLGQDPGGGMGVSTGRARIPIRQARDLSSGHAGQLHSVWWAGAGCLHEVPKSR